MSWKAFDDLRERFLGGNYDKNFSDIYYWLLAIESSSESGTISSERLALIEKAYHASKLQAEKRVEVS